LEIGRLVIVAKLCVWEQKMCRWCQHNMAVER